MYIPEAIKFGFTMSLILLALMFFTLDDKDTVEASTQMVSPQMMIILIAAAVGASGAGWLHFRGVRQ